VDVGPEIVDFGVVMVLFSGISPPSLKKYCSLELLFGAVRTPYIFRYLSADMELSPSVGSFVSRERQYRVTLGFS
jgi:hypothetical protein